MTDGATHYARLDGPHLRGQATEAIVTAEFIKRGVPVLFPAYDNEPYDLVIDYGNAFYRLQVKTGYEQNGTVTFETVSARSRADGYERSDYRNDVDYFVVYSPTTEQTYLVSVGDASSGKMQLRFEPPANNQRVGVNWHESYGLETVLAELE